jgi:hypothetical protein
MKTILPPVLKIQSKINRCEYKLNLLKNELLAEQNKGHNAGPIFEKTGHQLKSVVIETPVITNVENILNDLVKEDELVVDTSNIKVKKVRGRPKKIKT